MKNLLFTLSLSLVSIGIVNCQSDNKNSNPEFFEYINEDAKSVLLLPMGDSLILDYRFLGTVVLYLDIEATEVEGLAVYIGKLKSRNLNCEIFVQFLDEDRCIIDSECKKFNMGICNFKETKSHNSPFGKDQGGKITGTGTDNGTESLEKRKLISDIPNGEIESNVNGYIYFKLSVNADGDVVAVVIDTKKTTITDAVFIAKMTSLIKKHVQYNKRSTGSAIEQVGYAKKVNAL